MSRPDHPGSGSTAAMVGPMVDRAEMMQRARQVFRDVVADPTAFGALAVGIAQQARAADHPEALVLALRAQAWSERARLGNQRAKELLDEAARIARRAGFDEGLSKVLATRAAVNQELGRLIPAQRDLDAAARLDQGIDSAEIVFQQAILYQNLGKLSQARELYRRILADDASVVVRTKSANNLAIIESQWGNRDEAQQLIELAASLATKAGPHLIGIVASSRAWITTTNGRLTQGIAEFVEAARLLDIAGLPLAEHYLEYVDALADLRLLPEAVDVAVRAADDFDVHGIRLMLAEALFRVARLAALRGDDGTAVAAGARARELFDEQRRLPWRARTDVVVGDVELRTGRITPQVLAVSRRAAALLDRMGLVSYAIDAHLTAGRIAQALDRPVVARTNLRRAEAIGRDLPVLLRLKGRLAGALDAQQNDGARLAHCRAGLQDLARHRAVFSSLELRVLASGHGAELGRLGLRVLLRHGTSTQVFDWMERTRAAALVAVEPAAGGSGIDDELSELRVVQTDLAEAQQQDVDQVGALLVRQRAIEDRIRRVTWSRPGRAGTAGGVPSIAELRRGLADRILVEFGVLDGEVFAVVVDQRKTRLVTLGPVADIHEQVTHLQFGLRSLTRRGRSAQSLAAYRAGITRRLTALGSRLMVPLRLPTGSSVVVSPAGGLQRIPWSALHDGPVAVVPAASMWNRTNLSPSANDSAALLIAGPQLPGAVDEVDRVGRIYRSPTVLRPPDSTIDAVVAAMAGADLVHLACHGRLRSDNPAFSALQLQDGLLTLHEMEIRGVAPQRIILAACDSAADAVYEGNEVLGFVSALLARGSRALVASIAVVPDAASVPLMLALHERLRNGDSFGDALFAARSTLDTEDPREFVNWCSFNAYGAA